MKRVLVSNAAADSIAELRDSTGGYECVKFQIADTLSKLAKMLNHGISGTDEEIHLYATDIVEAMDVVADYNELVDKLNDLRDVKLPRYILEKNEEYNNCTKYDYAPNERELAAIRKILKDKGIDELPGNLTLDEMTFYEIADAIGMSNEDLHTLVCYSHTG